MSFLISRAWQYLRDDVARVAAPSPDHPKRAAPYPSVFSRRPWGGPNAQLGFQRGDAHFKRFVFLACQPRHVLDRLELLALDDVEIAQDFFGLVAHHGIDLALDALGR